MNLDLEFARIFSKLKLKDTPRRKPEDLIISAKAWRIFRKIREVDSTFVPRSEVDIWMKAEELNL